MEYLVFTVVAVALYFISDRVVNLVETRRGSRFEHRSLIFFAIIFALAVLSFNVLERLFGPPAGGESTSATAPAADSRDSG